MHSGEMLPSRRRRIPSTRAHVLYTLETWSFHVSVLLNISPRCLCVLTWGMGTPFIRTSGLCFAVLPIARCLLLGALKSMPHLSNSAHDAAVSRSELRRAQLDMLDLSAVCNVVSSAKIEHWLWVDSGRSLIKIRKSTGPRTVPYGIYPWLWGQWCRCCAVQKNTLFSVREEAGEPFSGRWAKSYQGKFAQQSWNRYPIISFAEI